MRKKPTITFEQAIERVPLPEESVFMAFGLGALFGFALSKLLEDPKPVVYVPIAPESPSGPRLRLQLRR